MSSLLNSLKATDTGADQDAGASLLFVGFRLETGISHRLIGSCHGVDDEVVDLALFLGLHPVVRIEAAIAPVPARNLAGIGRAQM